MLLARQKVLVKDSSYHSYNAMNKTIEAINRVLADWNPINVPDHVATDEYRAYIPSILQSIESRQQLIDCLTDLLINRLGTEYQTTNESHLKDLLKVADKLLESYKRTRTPY